MVNDDLFSPEQIEALLKHDGKGLQDILGGNNEGGPIQQRLHHIMQTDSGQVRAIRHGRKHQRAFSLSDEAYSGLEQIARENGLLWGSRGNVSELLELLGAGIFKVIH